ncbi:MAG: hypothetical protein RLZZ28_2637 [Bacteroidota bacterium]
MVFLFRDKSIINIFFLVMLSVGIHFHFLMTTPVLLSENNDGLFTLVLRNYLSNLPQTSLVVFYHLVVLIQAIRLNMVLNDFRMFQNNSYTTAMAYVLLSALFTQWCTVSAALLANFLLIWIFIKLSRLYNHPSPKTLLFNTGLIVGIAVLCYHPTAILILVVLFALAVVRPFKLAEWFILLMGILLPYYFLAAGLFLKDDLHSFSYYIPGLKLGLPLHQWNYSIIISVSLLTVYILVGLYYWQVSSSRMVIQIRKNWAVMIVMLLILIPIPFIYPNAGVESAFLLLVPMAAFTGNTFSYPRRLLFPNLLFWISLAVIVYNNWWIVKN